MSDTDDPGQGDAEDRAAFLRTVLDALPMGVFVVDGQGRPVYSNAAAMELLGRGADPDADADSLASVYGAYEIDTDTPYPSERMPILRALNGEQSSVSDMVIRQPRGDIPLRVWGRPARDAEGTITHAVAAFQDISSEDRARRSSLDYRGRLEASDAELREVQDRLTRHERLAVVGRLAGSVSHELRQPISIIINSAHAARMGGASATPRLARQIDRIERQAWQAERIISDLLDFSRDRQPEWQDVSALTLVETTLARHPVAEHVNVTTTLADGAMMRVDPTQIAHALTNVLRNASEAMDGEGEVRIEAARRGARIILEVTDSGSGIAPEMMHQLFEPLVTTKASGIGLGLVVASTFVERNGGKLSARNAEGGGAVFTLDLPGA